MWLPSFIDEIEKIAASVQQLQQGVRRLGFIRTPRVKSLNRVTESLQNLLTGGKLERGLSTPERMVFTGGAMTLSPKRLMPELGLQSRRAVVNAAVAVGHPRQEIEQAIAQSLPMAKKLEVLSPVRRGTIMSGRGRINPGEVFNRIGVGSLSPEGRKALNVSTLHHEGFERAALGKPKELAYGFGHTSPDVLMKEHNLLSRLTGPGSLEAKGAIQEIRANQGDAKALSSALTERFGPRAELQFGEGQKIPKAMRKAFMKKVPETWRSMPAALVGG